MSDYRIAQQSHATQILLREAVKYLTPENRVCESLRRDVLDAVWLSGWTQAALDNAAMAEFSQLIAHVRRQFAEPPVVQVCGGCGWPRRQQLSDGTLWCPECGGRDPRFRHVDVYAEPHSWSLAGRSES